MSDVWLGVMQCKFEQCKALKKDISKELIAVAWHATRSWNWCL